MTHPALTATRTAAARVADRWVADLADHGFADFLATAETDLPDRRLWYRAASATSGALRRLVGLFLLAEPQPVSELPAGVAAAVPLLVRTGVARSDDDQVQLPDLVLFRPRGVWLLAEPPSPVAARYYFGRDSLSLAGRVVVPVTAGQARCLDLCAGTGFVALALACRGARVTLAELHPDIAGVACVNAALNGLSARTQVLVGNLYAPLDRPRRFDVVTANIPFLPRLLPADDGNGTGTGGAATGREHVAGHDDGFDLGRSVLAGLHHHLEPGGSAHLTALFFQGADGLELEPELAGWAQASGLGMTVVLGDRMAVDEDSDLVQDIAWAADGVTSAQAARRAAALAAGYAGRGITAARLAYLSVRAAHAGVRVVDPALSSTG